MLSAALAGRLRHATSVTWPVQRFSGVLLDGLARRDGHGTIDNLLIVKSKGNGDSGSGKVLARGPVPFDSLHQVRVQLPHATQAI